VSADLLAHSSRLTVTGKITNSASVCGSKSGLATENSVGSGHYSSRILEGIFCAANGSSLPVRSWTHNRHTGCTEDQVLS
jgi:hypothetical protein